MSTVHSKHQFIFPFKWEHYAVSNDSFASKTNVEGFESILLGKKWKRTPFEITSHIRYNEYNYFYDFVRDVVYDRGQNESSIRGYSNKSLLRHYEYIFKNSASLKITCNIGKDDFTEFQKATYELEIKCISLELLDSGIGLLTYNIHNSTYEDPSSILNINQFGRRFFIGGFMLNTYPSRNLKETGRERCVDLALQHEILDGHTRITNDLYDEDTISNLKLSQHLELPEIVKNLFLSPEKLKTNFETLQKGEIWLSPCIDDRLFTVCWYSCNLKKYRKAYQFGTDITKSKWWNKFVFIDKAQGESVQNEEFRLAQLESSTYDRWKDYSTLYGVSRYSLMMFCTPDAPDFLKAVHETMYFKMAQLNLVQRATMLRLSDEIQSISTSNLTDIEIKLRSETKQYQRKELQIQLNEKIKVEYEKVRDLNHNFLKFSNKIYFEEVTAQEQGIELYDLLHQKMRNQMHKESLEKEISSLFNFSLLQQQNRENQLEIERNNKLELITYFGIPLAFLSLIFSFWSLVKDISTSTNNEQTFRLNIYTEVWIGELILVALFFFTFKIFLPALQNQEPPKRAFQNIFRYSILVILGFLALIFPFIYYHLCIK